MNHGDTEDNEIVDGDEGNLPPVDGVDIPITDDSVVEQSPESFVAASDSHDELPAWEPIEAQYVEQLDVPHELVEQIPESIIPDSEPIAEFIECQAGEAQYVGEAEVPDAVIEQSTPDPAAEFAEWQPGEAQYAEVYDAELQEPLPDAPDPVEIVTDSQEPVSLPIPPTAWERVRRIFTSSPTDLSARLDGLTRAIEDAPEAAVNYVLRAELYMDLREYALAQSDFQVAYEVAEAQFEVADWGLLEQAMRDRALAGLEKVQRRL